MLCTCCGGSDHINIAWWSKFDEQPTCPCEVIKIQDNVYMFSLTTAENQYLYIFYTHGNFFVSYISETRLVYIIRFMTN